MLVEVSYVDFEAGYEIFFSYPEGLQYFVLAVLGHLVSSINTKVLGHYLLCHRPFLSH